jgi:hypothetical protein
MVVSKHSLAIFLVLIQFIKMDILQLQYGKVNEDALNLITYKQQMS